MDTQKITVGRYSLNFHSRFFVLSMWVHTIRTSMFRYCTYAATDKKAAFSEEDRLLLVRYKPIPTYSPYLETHTVILKPKSPMLW